MKIVYFYQSLARYGGVERVLIDKVNYIAAHFGYEVYMVTRDQGDHPIPFPLHKDVHYADLGIRLHRQYAHRGVVRLLVKWWLLLLYDWRVGRLLGRIRPDIVVGTDAMPAGALLRHKGGAKLIIESHSMYRMTYADRGKSWVKRMQASLAFRAYRKADLLVALTEGDAKDWREKNRNPHVVVLPNIVNLNTSGQYSEQTAQSAIYVGRFAYLKGIGHLIDVWRIVHQRHKDWTLHIYGDGEEKERWLSVIEKEGLNIVVHEPTSDIHEAYRNSSIGLLTSLAESFSLVLVEEMSWGLPVVSFDTPCGPPDIITDGKDGYLVPQFDATAFADRVCKLIENEELRRSMGRNAIETSKKYSADNIMNAWKSLIEQLV